MTTELPGAVVCRDFCRAHRKPFFLLCLVTEREALAGLHSFSCSFVMTTVSSAMGWLFLYGGDVECSLNIEVHKEKRVDT